MKVKVLALMCLLGIATMLSAPAEENQQLYEAMKNGLGKIRELLLQRQLQQQQNGLTVCWLTLFNSFEDGEEFARNNMREMMPLLRGNGELSVLDGVRARYSSNIKANQFLTEDEAKTLFSKLSCDYILLAKIDETGKFIIIGIDGNGDAELISEVPFDRDDEYFKLVDGYIKPPLPDFSHTQLTGEVKAVEYTADGGAIVVGLKDGEVSRVDAVTKNIISVLREKGQSSVNDVSVGPKNQILAATDTGLILIKAANDEVVFDAKPGTAVAVTSATETVIGGFREGRISLYGSDGTKIMDMEGVRGAVKDVCLSQDERHVYAIDQTGVGLWSVLSGKKIASVSGAFTAITVCPRGTYVALASNKEITLFEMDLKKKKLAIIPNDIGDAAITTLATSNNGLILVAGLINGTMHSFLPTTGKQVHILTGAHTAAVNCIRFRPGAETFATGSDDARLGLWTAYKEPSARLDITNRIKTSASIVVNNGTTYEIDPTKTLSLTLPIGQNRIELLNPSTAVINNNAYSTTLRFDQNETKKFSITESSGSLDADNKSRIAPRLLAVLDDKIFTAYTIKIPELVGKLTARLAAWNMNGDYQEQGNDDEQHQLTITGIVASPDGYAYTVSDDFSLKVWRREGKLIKSIDNGEAIYSVDYFGNTLLTSSFTGIKLWDRTKLEPLNTIAIEGTGPAIFDGTGSIIAIKDGYILVRYGADGKQQPVVFPREVGATESITFPVEITGLKRGEEDTIMVLLSDKTIEVRNTLSRFQISGVCAIQTKDGITIAGQEDGSLYLHDSRTGKRLPSPLPRHEKRIYDLADIGGNCFASTGADGVLMVANYMTGRVVLRSYLYSDGDKVALNANGKYRGDSLHLVWRSGEKTTAIPNHILNNKF